MNILDNLIYLFTMSVTPGPNTILSLQNASEKGIRKGIVLNWGMFFGIAAVTIITFAFTAVLSAVMPQVKGWLQISSILYLVYLAWKMYRKDPVNTAEGSVDGSFRRGFFMQIVNVKVLMLALSAISTYILPYSENAIEGALLSMTIPLVCFLTGLIWAVAGEALKNVYNAHTKGANIVFSLSLLILAVKNAIMLVLSL